MLPFETRYTHWLKNVQRYAQQHGITETQAIAIVFLDHQFDFSKEELFWAEHCDFVLKFKKDQSEEALAEIQKLNEEDYNET